MFSTSTKIGGSVVLLIVAVIVLLILVFYYRRKSKPKKSSFEHSVKWVYLTLNIDNDIWQFRIVDTLQTKLKATKKTMMSTNESGVPISRLHPLQLTHPRNQNPMCYLLSAIPIILWVSPITIIINKKLKILNFKMNTLRWVRKPINPELQEWLPILTQAISTKQFRPI